MLIDAQELLSDAQPITADTTSTFVIDTLPSGGSIGAGATGGPQANTTSDYGAGELKYLHVFCNVTFDSAADSTSLQLTLESSADTNFGTPTVHWTGPDIEQVSLVAGAWIARGIPIPTGTYKRYLGVRYNVGAEENFTAGALSAWISTVPAHDERQYATARLTGIN